jgi:site-specific DNA recombinase
VITKATRAAIYTRYSTDKQSEDSIAAQVSVCTKHAQTQGSRVAHVFKDEGISGAAIGNRPGFKAMMAAAGEDFAVLLVMDLSRLSRNQADLPKAIQQLTHKGVRVIGVQDGYDSSRKGHKLQAGFSGVMGEAFRDMVADKTYAALQMRANDGRPTGGRAFGYRVVHELHDTLKDERGRPKVMASRLEIDPAQAAVVRDIYLMYAEGASTLGIAAELNRRGVASPGSSWRRDQRRKSHWLASTISSNPKRGLGILNNEIYRGVVIWNRSRWEKDPDTGVRECRERPGAEWIRQDRPELRIVDDKLWARVRARQAAQSRDVGEAVRRGLLKGLQGRPDGAGRHPKWLLSGLLKCSRCGASLVMTDGHNYSCSSYRNGGVAACASGVKVHRTTAERLLLANVKDELLTPELIALVQAEVRALIRSRERSEDADVRGRERRLAEVDTAIANVMRAIKAGIFTSSTKAELEALEREKAELLAAASVGAPSEKVVRGIARVADHYRRLVCDFEDRAAQASPRDIARARTDLRALLGVVRIEGIEEEGRLVPYGVVQGIGRTLLRAAVGAQVIDPKGVDICGSGGRI